MRVIKLFSMIVCVTIMVSQSAIAEQADKSILNTVSIQLSADKWTTTSTAKVIVTVNAILSDQELGTINDQILQKLNKIVSSEWHIIQFNRSLNSSGLEQLEVLAETRIPATQLANLRNQAKVISKAGETYTISAIDFSPTLAEIEKTKAELRNQLYQEIVDELAKLNKTYPNQKFFLHGIDFSPANVVPIQPSPKIMVMTAVPASTRDALQVSNKITVNADVVLASQENIAS